MTLEAQRIAIAEACGWTECILYNVWTGCILYNVESGKEPRGHPPKQQSCYQGYTELIPDYLSDLNAMHEAEKGLTDAQYFIYGRMITTVILRDEGPSERKIRAISATAAQRAEAFLRTLGKWTSP
tara:strand:- start:293 stop:670 length:378 start_codon:yes stop_codon:yes gene_type:complete